MRNSGTSRQLSTMAYFAFAQKTVHKKGDCPTTECASQLLYCNRPGVCPPFFLKLPISES
jgi:hypothetical protein